MAIVVTQNNTSQKRCPFTQQYEKNDGPPVTLPNDD